MTVKTDALSKGVIALASWALIVGGFSFALMFALDPAIPAIRVLINIISALLGVVVLLLVRYGRLRFAAHVIVWCMFGIITVSVWRNGGLHAPNILLYPVLIVLAGWLPSMPAGQPLSKLLFILFIVFITAGLILISRRSYLQRLEELEQTARELAMKDAELLKLSRAVEQSPDSIKITNLDAEIEYVNDAFVAHTGYSREEALWVFIPFQFKSTINQSGLSPVEQCHIGRVSDKS